MRWEQLFDDLEAQWGAEQRRDLDSRSPTARAGRAPSASTSGLRRRRARSSTCGSPPRALLRCPAPSQTSARTAVAPPASDPCWCRWARSRRCRAWVSVRLVAAAWKRFGLGYALRGLSRDRAVVALTDSAGVTTTGTIDAVGSNCFDLSEHAQTSRGGRRTSRGDAWCRSAPW